MTTNLYRWPPYQIGATWSVYTDEDLLAVTALETAVSGLNAVPIPITNYFLEPQQAGPPYSRIEIDISSTDAFQSGPTPQRSVSIQGQWGYTNATVPVGTGSGLSSDPTVTTMTCSSGASVDSGDVLLWDSEAIYVSSGGATILTIQRGVNGTTATVHTDGTAIRKYKAPADVARIVMQHAIGGYLEEQAAYLPQAWGQEGGGHSIVGSSHEALIDKMLSVIERYERPRTAAI